MSIQIGIIGGSGLYDMAELTDRRELTVDTPFGAPSGPYVTGTLGGVTPVTRVDGRVIGYGGPGPQTRRASELYLQLVTGAACEP